MENNFTFINGEYIPFSQAYLHVSDLIIQRGYGVFDFFLVKNGVPPFLSFHLDRLFNSAALLNLDPHYSKEELSVIVKNVIEKNRYQNSSVKIIISGGVSMDDFTQVKSSILIINKPFELPVSDAILNGGSLITSNYQRDIPEAKTINYIRAISVSRQIADSNAADVLYLDRNIVRECSRCNIFIVKGGIIYTPKSKMLKGITRKRILSMEGLNVQEKDFKFNDLLAADEVFITSTTKGVMPITKVNSKIISNGKVGAVTKAIQKLIMNG